MRASLWLSLAVLIAVVSNVAAETVPAEPKMRPAADARRIVEALPSYAKFGISGIAFHGAELLVTSNIGLLAVKGTELTHLYQWFDDANVVSGPWPDPAHGATWMFRDADGTFVRLDAAGWMAFALPRPPLGSYSRGDMLEGFSGVGGTDYFRVVGAGHVWSWHQPGAWKIDPRPPAPESGAVVGFASLGEDLLYIVQFGFCFLEACEYQAWWYRGGAWAPAVSLPIEEFGAVVAASDGIFVRGRGGELLRLSADGASPMTTPGGCEAIARRSDGRLLASFKNEGVYLWDGAWRRLFPAPYPRLDADQWVYLAESEGRVALATASVPSPKPGTDNEWIHTGIDALWVSEAGRLVRVNLTP